MTKYKDTLVLFSGSLDGKIKAWLIDFASKQLNQMDFKDLNVGINCLQMASDSFVVAGTASGSFKGWNLDSNSCDELPAHSIGVTSLHKVDDFLLSGDANGVIHVRSVAQSFNVLLSADPQQL